MPAIKQSTPCFLTQCTHLTHGHRATKGRVSVRESSRRPPSLPLPPLPSTATTAPTAASSGASTHRSTSSWPSLGLGAPRHSLCGHTVHRTARLSQQPIQLGRLMAVQGGQIEISGRQQVGPGVGLWEQCGQGTRRRTGRRNLSGRVGFKGEFVGIGSACADAVRQSMLTPHHQHTVTTTTTMRFVSAAAMRFVSAAVWPQRTTGNRMCLTL
jgi:hypothetical protein